ncbi:hypothetical protein ACIGW8_00655 [Streptomyces sioyaensis]|uniref:hypothetical protein n=1 Tax=Streptomyces sioyaensis TaxID=67364 RepID=UPI0037D69159
MLDRVHQVEQLGVGEGEVHIAADEPAEPVGELLARRFPGRGQGLVQPLETGQRQRVGRSAAAGDPQSAARLWQASEELTGVAFPPLGGRQVSAEAAR